MGKLQVTRWISIALSVAIGLTCIGCPTSSSGPQPEKKSEDAKSKLTAEEILLQTKLAYATQLHYSDNAKLYLSYRLQDRYVQEQQPWAIRWQRDVGFSLNQFNAEITHDGKRLSCFVFDNDTGNLDLQQLLVVEPIASSLQRVLRDSIARYYVSGHAELPIVAAEVDHETPLISPVWGWLNQQTQWPIFVAPDSSRRLADGLVDGKACYHLQVQRGELISELWIDQESSIVRQMTIPNQILDARVRQSPDVTDIQFFARMHDATFSPTLAENAFQIRVPAEAKPLQQFLAIPRPFPCDAIGKSAQPVLLQSPAGLPADIRSWDNRVSVLIWVGDDTLFQSVELSSSFFEWVMSSQLIYGLVYSDEHLAQIDSTQPKIPALIEQWNVRQPIAGECWYDPQSQWTQMIGLRNLPAAVVINQRGTIEYALSLSDSHWSEKLDGAISRILAGESIAAEMVLDYQDYLSRYRDRLEKVRSTELMDDAVTTPGKSKSIAMRELYRVNNLARPGNLYVSPSQIDHWYVLDGWRTIVEFDRHGTLVKKTQPELPPGAAIDSLRWNRSVNDHNRMGFVAAFSTLGKSIHLYDSNWQRMTTITIPESAQGLIDCCYVKRADKNSLWAIIAGLGLCEYTSDTGQWQVKEAEAFDQLAATEHELMLGGRGKLCCFDLVSQQCSKLADPVLASQQWTGIRAFDVSDPKSKWLLSSIAPGGQWKMQVMHQGQLLGDAVSGGSQLFDEPTEFLQTMSRPTAGSNLTVGLNRQGQLHLWNAAGEYLGQVWLGQSVTGYALVEWDGRPIILTATDKQVRVNEIEIK